MLNLIETNDIVWTQASGSDYPNQYPGISNAFNLAEFKKVSMPSLCIKWEHFNKLRLDQNFKVKIQRLSKHSVEFDLIGIDASIANAFRRVMIAEVKKKKKEEFNEKRVKV